MKHRKPLSDDEQTLFRDTVGPVRRLNPDRVDHARPRPSPRPQQRERDERMVLRQLLEVDPQAAELETGDELLFSRPGVQHGVLRKLRRGQFSVEDELDLHGMTVPVAHETVAEFLHFCQLKGNRCVRIIHGKGHGSYRKQPILKGKLQHWLRQRAEVLAFSSARPVDGGTGAVYVLLKKV